MAGQQEADPDRRRERRVLSSAVLTGGAAQVVDFVLPLYVGVAMGASAAQIGVLLAAEMAVSLLTRPVAGALADRYERRHVAACGALLYGAACLGYATAPAIGITYAAAAVGGAGGALLWVALRAIVGQRLTADARAFAQLLAAESTGGWVVFVPAMVLLGFADYRAVFFALAGCCVIATGMLLAGPKATAAAPVTVAREVAPAGFGTVGRRLRPMLLAVLVTMAAEAAVGLLLLLHLQRGFGLDPIQIAFVFLPGAIAMSVLPPWLHRLVRRFGRRRMLVASSVSSAAFAASMSFVAHPVLIALLWILVAMAWAVVLPVQQAVITEAVDGRQLGRGMGLYESAGLAGALLGSLGAGVLYDLSNWRWACLAGALVILSGAVMVPAAVTAVGAADMPAAPVPQVRPDLAEQR